MSAKIYRKETKF